MVREVLTASEEDFAQSALEAMRLHSIRHIPVLRGSELVGVVTERDLLRILPGTTGMLDAEVREGRPGVTVSTAMTRDPITVGPNDLIEDAARILAREKISGLPVVENGKLIGIVTCSDVLRVFTKLLAQGKGRRLTLMFSPENQDAVAFDPVLECIRRGIRVHGLLTHAVRQGSSLTVLRVSGREEKLTQFLEVAANAGCLSLGDGRRDTAA